MTPVEGSLFQVSKPAFQGQSLKVVRKSVIFSNVIVDIAFPRRSFVFSQSSCEVSVSLTDVGGVAVGAIDLIHCFLSVPRFVFVFDVNQLAT